MTYRPEPPYRHGQEAQTAVLLVNLGTPSEPTAPALRRYLAEFLDDPRVVEIPRLLWWPLLHGSGDIGLGSSPTDPAAAVVTFEVLHFSDTQASSGVDAR